MVEMNPSTPNGRNGVNWLTTSASPRINPTAPAAMKKVTIVTSVTTNHTCSCAVSLAPKLLRTANATVDAIARGWIGTSTNSALEAPIPTRANALLATRTTQAPRPPMVPARGPMLRWMKK